MRRRGGVLWALVGGALIVAAVVAAVLSPGRSGSLDPSSPAPNGSKALASVLRGYGVDVRVSRDLTGATGRVVVTDPGAYSRRQLRALASRAELVLLGGGRPVLAALGVRGGPAGSLSGDTAPGCPWAGARAAGTVDLPDGTPSMSVFGTESCYEGAVVRGAGWVLLSTPRLIRNDTVSRAGVAALDVNAITADRTVTTVTWLRPGTAATGSAAPSTWALFPGGARRAAGWLVVVAVLLALWRGRRFGRVVTEPLPVLVRAAELVEGHGRLYRRAAARGRAAGALRDGAAGRLGSRLGLPPTAPRAAVVTAAAERSGRPEAEVADLLAGPAPRDDAALVRLACALDDLQVAAGIPLPARSDHPPEQP